MTICTPDGAAVFGALCTDIQVYICSQNNFDAPETNEKWYVCDIADKDAVM